MADIFPSIGNPDWGLSESTEDTITEIKMGDGYVLRSPDGINFRRDTWSPKWSSLDDFQGENTYQWLKARKNLTPFLWDHPIYGTKKVVCKSCSLVRDTYGNTVLSATFEEDFNP